jgi:Tfp pilus assembly protein PilN
MEKVGVAQKMSLRVFGVVLAAVCLFVLFGMGLQIQNYANRLKSAQLHLASIKDIGLLKQKIQSLETLANYIKIGNVPTGGLLKNLSGLVPAEIILSELVLDQPAHSLILKGAASVGKDSGESTLINFIKDIEMSPFFKEATLVSSNNLGSIQEFEIRCELAL